MAASSNDIADCPFCGIEPSRIIRESALTIAFWDGFPVSAGHALVVPQRHVISWVDTTLEEKHELVAAIDVVRALVDERHNPDGYNVGINDGAAAGQTVMHLHVHVIPRYEGDSADPRGGVRWVLADKARYW